MRNTFILFIVLLSLLQQALAVQFFNALAQLTTVWPVPGQTADKLAATFGPRVKNSNTPYDWHRGIDITGTRNEPIVASFAGTVVQITTTTSGGLQVVLEHDFGQPVQFHNHQVTKFYSFYMHLESTSVSETDVVTAGQEIGKMGDSGLTEHVHLHHEIRVGTRCSLEYAVDNPQSSCNTLGVDPHVNPILAYPQDIVGPSALSASLLRPLGLNRHGVVLVQGPANRPDPNRFLIQVFQGNTRIRNFLLDLNLRIGFDATSNDALDIPDKSKPHLFPLIFQTASTVYKTRLVVPHVWVPDTATRVVAHVYNVRNQYVGTVVLCRGTGAQRCNRVY